MKCYTPYILHTGTPVPCGSCINCHKTRSNAWAFRLFKEKEVHTSAYFVTLTYNDRCLPHTDDEYDLPTLNRKHVKDYFKRLRQRIARAGDPQTLKYYAVGEYGSKGSRPHYHAIVFDARLEFIDSCWTLPVGDSKHHRIKAGTVHIEPVNMATIRYVTKYLYKGRSVPEFKGDPRLREFSNMSKGLGLNYLTEAIFAWHKADISRNYVTLLGGEKSPLPRYFREKLFTKEEREQQALLLAAKHIVEHEFSVRKSGLSHSEYAKQQHIRRVEQMRLLRRREDLIIRKL